MKTPETIRVIFAGTGEFGAPILQKLMEDPRIEIPFVITAPDKAAGRKLQTKASDIKRLATLNKLFVQQPQFIEELEQKIIQAKADIMLVVAYGELIPEKVLNIPRLGSVNIHPSLLPRYRGASPIQHALLHLDQITGVTWIEMNKRMDAGPVVAQKEISIDPGDTAKTLSQKLSELAAQLTPDVLLRYMDSRESFSQDDLEATYCKKISKQDGYLDVYKEDAPSIIAKVKAFTPWPGCSIPWGNARLKIVRAHADEQKISSGELRVLDGKILHIGTKNGTLIPEIVQPESKRAMSIGEFLRGQRNLPTQI